jgi:antitoxin HicB
MEPAELLKKPYARLVLPDEDGTVAAEIIEFPGCIAVGANATEALANLEEVAADWIRAALEQGQDIPEPMDAAGYSGKFVVRMSKSLHKRASLCAERDGVSLNQFIVTCVAEHVGERARPALVYSSQPQFQLLANANFQIVGGTSGMVMTSIIGHGFAAPQPPITTGQGPMVLAPSSLRERQRA